MSGGGIAMNFAPLAGVAVGVGATSMVFASDGQLTTAIGPANWFAPTTLGIGSSWWMRVTKTAGAANWNLATGVWLSLSAGLSLSAASAAVVQGYIEFAPASDGTGALPPCFASANGAA